MQDAELENYSSVIVPNSTVAVLARGPEVKSIMNIDDLNPSDLPTENWYYPLVPDLCVSTAG